MSEHETVADLWKRRIAEARASLLDMMTLPPHLTMRQRSALEQFFDQVEHLAEESEGDDALRTRLAALLTGVANGLKGPPPPLTQWDWSDLPAKAEAARLRIAELEAVWSNPAALHVNLLRSGYPRENALHLAGATDYDAIKAENATLHRHLAAETLRADQGWQRYESANSDRNAMHSTFVELNEDRQQLRAQLKAVKEHVSGFACWWAMVEAQEELGGTPIQDDATILHFSGSGASTMVKAREIRRIFNTIYRTET